MLISDRKVVCLAGVNVSVSSGDADKVITSAVIGIISGTATDMTPVSASL
jgi:hypothetical protein